MEPERDQGEESGIEPAPESPGQDDPALTVSFLRRVRPGREVEYEAALADLIDSGSRFPGYLDSRVIRPRRGSRDYRVVVRFAHESDAQRWKHSPERQEWLARVEELAEPEVFVANITGTAQERRLAFRLARVDTFVQSSVSGIGLLLLGTVVALILANSPLSEAYERFWQTELTIGVEGFGITESLRHWINDGLMALFFFIVGLEIKRELLVGDLRYPRQAALPIAAALGGAVVPALIYAALNFRGEGLHGWGVPIATDTAFSLGVITLLGTRVRPLLLVFLTAFAIVDDILAVSVIAIFYTASISWPALGIAVALLAALVVANIAGVHRWPVYGLLGLGVWVAIFESGVHGTLAGVLVAMTVPARSWINPSEFLVRARKAIDDFEAACYATAHMLSNEPQQRATQTLEQLCEEVETPMTHLQHRLNPWVAYGVLPLFALANAGIPLLTGLGEVLASPVSWGVMAGLVLGKPLGITLFTWLAVRLGIALKPGAIAWRHIAGVALLGGIGFTMSLFITELAFRNAELAHDARVGILIGSVVAGVAGYLVLRATLPPPREDEA
jgi:NhaA family Na+:H+ antiporter